MFCFWCFAIQIAFSHLPRLHPWITINNSLRLEAGDVIEKINYAASSVDETCSCHWWNFSVAVIMSVWIKWMFNKFAFSLDAKHNIERLPSKNNGILLCITKCIRAMSSSVKRFIKMMIKENEKEIRAFFSPALSPPMTERRAEEKKKKTFRIVHHLLYYAFDKNISKLS